MGRDSDCIYCPSCGNWRFVKSGDTTFKDEIVWGRRKSVMLTKCKCTACKHKWTHTDPDVEYLRKHMKERYGVDAAGEVGKVYTTRTGMEEADPYEHDYGWEQVEPVVRARVQSRDIGMHQRWYIWKRVAKPEKERTT